MLQSNDLKRLAVGRNGGVFLSVTIHESVSKMYSKV